MEFYVKEHLIINGLRIKSITTVDVLRYLISSPVSINTLIAYRHVFFHVPGRDHYVDGVHFLAKADPRYAVIYLLLESTKVCPLIGGEEVDIETLLFKEPQLIDLSPPFCQRMLLITGLCKVNLPSIRDIPLIVYSRNSKILETIPKVYCGQILSWAIKCDWIEVVSEYIKYSNLDAVMPHCLSRQSHAPLEYWSSIKSGYESMFKKHMASGFHIPHKDLPKIIKQVFPTIFPSLTDTFNELAWYIYQLPLGIQGYLLGYPINNRTPSRDMLNAALCRLSKDGIDAYCDAFSENQKKILSAGESFAGISTDFHISNEEDTCLESVFSYSPFDIYSVFIDDKRFIFTRPEFPTLLKKGTNIWTNTELSALDIFNIAGRAALAGYLRLPPSKPLKSLLEEVLTYPVDVTRQGAGFDDPSQ